jgi:two-component system NtrC family sensor kinase
MAKDLREYQNELMHSAKMAAMGEMASEIAHEFQNRISGLSLWIQFLDSELPMQDPRKAFLEEMKKGLRSFLDLLDALKQFYKTPILHRTPTDINALVREAEGYVQNRLAESNTNLELNLAADLPNIEIDGEKIKSVLLNLLLNALEATSDGGHIQVRTTKAMEGDRSFIHLAVTDDGCGIEEHNLRRIFYPFHSTKAAGSGLGLAIASNMVNAHGGRIQVESKVGSGSTFTLILPLDSAAQGQRLASPADGATPFISGEPQDA